MNINELFHPSVAQWFTANFPTATDCQIKAWPAIKSGQHVLLAAPTGSGKTLAAFLSAIDDLVRAYQSGQLDDQTRVVYVSPLKALSNDIQKNLLGPLSAICGQIESTDDCTSFLRVMVRTGDTPPGERTAMVKKPPHILVTTPESLYILLTSRSGRTILQTTRVVIIDEIHALVTSKRGSHLALSLERLQALTKQPLQRIGLSATQKPLAEVARFLVGNTHQQSNDVSHCQIIDHGYTRERDLAILVPQSPLSAVMSNEVWSEIYDQLTTLTEKHRTTLIFVNTRRLAERVARHLTERLGEAQVTTHHGSLSKEQRLQAEQRLKSGSLRALVATASLELGIDIGDVDLVCQLGSPRSIATFLQRVGRARHQVGGCPKGRLFPLTRDELIEALALFDAIDRQELDCLIIPKLPADVLAQQIIAMVANQDWAEDELYAVICRAYPFAELTRQAFDDLMALLVEGYSTQHGRRAAYLHYDSVQRRLRARKGALLTAVTSGGTIPDTADYEVRQEPTGTFVGTVNEDFAIESLAGDIFQLGNMSWRILRVEAGIVRVEDAQGQPPNIPFWFGEAPARSEELSMAVSRLRQNAENHLQRGDRLGLTTQLTRISNNQSAAEQATDYLTQAHAALGHLPSQVNLVMERFFDESGGMQLVIHSPFGGRLNRAWGLALRKCFCRRFNFELQAAANEDAIVLSLPETHSFPLSDVWQFLHPNSVADILTQALLAAPMFTARWRWNAVTSLALPRFRGGKKVPPQLQRMRAEDLLAAVFPDQVACFENLTGKREIPDHPLVQQTLQDCLVDAMDLAGLEQLLDKINNNNIGLYCCDLTEPSPLALEILNARPYAFLDDAPLEERRTQAVVNRRWLTTEQARELGRLDPEAIRCVRVEAWPSFTTADELHEALLIVGFFCRQDLDSYTSAELTSISQTELHALWTSLLSSGRTACFIRNVEQQDEIWCAIERLPEIMAVYPDLSAQNHPAVPMKYSTKCWTAESALKELIRDRMACSGPMKMTQLQQIFVLPSAELQYALTALETEGGLLRGCYSQLNDAEEWCDRRLLARIHRYTLKRLRREIEPVSCAEYLRFLAQWQHITADTLYQGQSALLAVLQQLEGFIAPASAWETDILPIRIRDYAPHWLDELCRSGQVVWRCVRSAQSDLHENASIKSAGICFIFRQHLGYQTAIQDPLTNLIATQLSHQVQMVYHALQQYGACFFEDLLAITKLLPAQLEESLSQLVGSGMIHNDSFAALKTLLIPASKRLVVRGRRRMSWNPMDAGRWALSHSGSIHSATSNESQTLEWYAEQLLKRYGVVSRRIISRENQLPSWRELLNVYRRMEDQGRIRGGYFISGLTGGQFALPNAVGLLRNVRKSIKTGELLAISAVDPLNLIGIITPGQKVTALASNRIIIRDGEAIARYVAKQIEMLPEISPETHWQIKQALISRAKSKKRPYFN